MKTASKSTACATMALAAFLFLPSIAQAASKCVSDDSNFVRRDGKFLYETSLINICGQRLRCTLNVLVTDATGIYRDKTVLMLPAQTSGQPTITSWPLKVGAAGGSGQVAYDCN